MTTRTPTRVVILGGGFGGLAAARELERVAARDTPIEVTLVSRDNFFLFTPMLHEIAASDLDIVNIVNPLRKLVKRTRLFIGSVDDIDLDAKAVTVSHDGGRHGHRLPYDHLVVALGAVTNYYGIPGLAERAAPMKSLGDAIHLRNQLIQHLEDADFECARDARAPLLTVLVAGGGFAGVETVAAVHDFLNSAVKFYRNVSRRDVRVVLVHPGAYLLPELGEELGRYAEARLAERGVEILLNTRVTSVDGDLVELGDGQRIATRNLVWTAGTVVNPLVAALSCRKDRGRVVVDEMLQVPGFPGVWAVGDCAAIPSPDGATYPPTAQHALREGKIVARNIVAVVRGGAPRPFVFSTIGLLAAIGRRTGVANILGHNFSGFVAWWLWRTIYLSKLPRFEKKFRVALDWTLDLLFSKDLVQFGTKRSLTLGESPTVHAVAQAMHAGDVRPPEPPAALAVR